jgi:kynurenine formamidase
MQVRRIVDLSVPIGPDTQVYPGDPQPQLTPQATLDRDGYNLLALHLGSQTGTHVDAPYHVRADGTRVDALDLALCTGPATVLDVSGAPPKTPITADLVGDLIADLTADVPLRPILLIHTGWARHYGTPATSTTPSCTLKRCAACSTAACAPSASTPPASTRPPTVPWPRTS